MCRLMYSLAGSSPREWGTLNPQVQLAIIARFIPTRVGNTTTPGRRRIFAAVHPHASGEHYNRHHQQQLVLGSSPREWGTPLNVWLADCVRRFIPTRVGNTLPMAGVTDLKAVHPHASGEHPKRRVHAPVASGSSPREWGTRPHCHVEQPRRRFIPTRVGNTPSRH